MATKDKYASAICTRATLTNGIMQTNSPVSCPGCGRSLAKAYITALVTSADGTDLSNLDATELNDVDTYISSIRGMGANTASGIWQVLCEKDEPDETLFCSSRPHKRLRFADNKPAKKPQAKRAGAKATKN